MTKFEWERRLRKGISGLPHSEQRRVLDYYSELFSDKIDAGMREEEIIAEFGNPYEVANKILVDFYSDGKETTETDEFLMSEPEKEEERRKTDVKKSDKNHKYDASKTKSTGSLNGVIVLICILIFFVMGAFFGKWHSAWLVFLFIPVLTSLTESIERRSAKYFAYPVLVTVVYLLLGFYAHKWHPMWVLFLTIPLYYTILSYLSKNGKSNGDCVKSFEETEKPHKEKRKDEESRKKRGKTTILNILVGIIVAIVLVSVMVAVWTTVISLFVSGIGMIVGGVIALIPTAIAFATGATSAAVMLGCTLVVLGFGFLFTFGIQGMFGLCKKMTKLFCNTISACFGEKE